MSSELWKQVDQFLEQQLLTEDAVLKKAVRASESAGLPAIQVSALQGQFLQTLARSVSARRILEIGTLGGYSTIWLARALPANGRLVTLELEQVHADVAANNLLAAGVADKVDLRVGPASRSLDTLEREQAGPFDFIFIDADKQGYPGYFRSVLRLARPGSLIIADNVVRGGAVTDPDSDDERVQGVRQLLELVAGEPRVTATVLQTVGSKGYDGFLLARVN